MTTSQVKPLISPPPLGKLSVAKPELGTKRICPQTGRKFYDLGKTPVISPYTGEVVPIAPIPVSRARAETAARAPLVPEPVEAEAPETADVELVSLEEADADAEGGAKKIPVAEGEEEDETADDAAPDDATFLEPDEDEGDDVTGIIGGDIETEEET
jgi:uncharacterized protein (TIGR02300 family)